MTPLTKILRTFLSGSELQAVAPATVTFVVDVYCTNMQTLHVQNECGPKKTEATNSWP